MKRKSISLEDKENLFALPESDQNVLANAPLSFRMRPQTLEEYVGQEHILGKGKFE